MYHSYTWCMRYGHNVGKLQNRPAGSQRNQSLAFVSAKTDREERASRPARCESRLIKAGVVISRAGAARRSRSQSDIYARASNVFRCSTRWKNRHSCRLLARPPPICREALRSATVSSVRWLFHRGARYSYIELAVSELLRRPARKTEIPVLRFQSAMLFSRAPLRRSREQPGLKRSCSRGLRTLGIESIMLGEARKKIYHAFGEEE